MLRRFTGWDSQRSRIEAEVAMLESVYRDVEYDRDHLRWVCAWDFALPPGYNKARSGLLIELPLMYPLICPCNFFLDRTVKTSSGRDIEHYYPNENQNKYRDSGWAWFSVHIESWRVISDVLQSDNLLTAADVAYLALNNLVM